MMLRVNIFIFIILSLIVNSVLAINDTLPDTPSHFISNTKLLPSQSASTKISLPFQEYIPVACFCDWSKCNANIPPIESPIIGLLTRDGKIVKKLEIEVSKGELMYIILLDGKSSLADDTYLERTYYWRLTNGQHEVLAGIPLDLEISRQVSVSVLKEDNPQFTFKAESKRTAINALEISSGFSISPSEEFETKATYHYSASQFSQVTGIYQLIRELVIHPGASLTNYIESQKTGARCSQYIIKRGKCGFLQLLPSFLQHTPVFRQVAIGLTTGDSATDSIDQNSNDTENLKSKTRALSRKKIAVIISVSIVGVLLVVSISALWYYNSCRNISSRHNRLPRDEPESDRESIMMEKKADQVMPLI